MEFIYHILLQADWDAQKKGIEYCPESLSTEGFIHCCAEDQVVAVQERYYRDKSGLMILKVNPLLLKSPVRWEKSPVAEELFPHIYGPLNHDAIDSILPLTDELLPVS